MMRNDKNIEYTKETVESLRHWFSINLNSIVKFYVESMICPLLDFLFVKNEEGEPSLLKDKTKNFSPWFLKPLDTVFPFKYDMITKLSSLIQHGVVTISNVQFLVVIPVILLMSKDQALFPIALLLSVTIGEFEAFRQQIDLETYVVITAEKEKKEICIPGTDKSDKTSFPHNKDNEREAGFEVVTIATDHPQHILDSWVAERTGIMREKFLRKLSHKAFVIPLWIHFLAEPRNGFWHNFCLVWLIICETANSFIVCKVFFTGLPPIYPKDDTKMTFDWDRILPILELVGAVFWVLPPIQVFRPFGLFLLLCLVCPIAHYNFYQNQRKKHGVIYVSCDTDVLDYRLIRLWMQSRSMGTKLIVGLVDKATPSEETDQKKDMVKNICSVPWVDQVILGAPMKVDLLFLEKHSIDIVIGTEATNQVISEGKCWILEDVDNHRPKARQVGRRPP